MIETEERRAGAIILKDLRLFNKAATFFENQVEPLICIEFGRFVAEWAEEQSWKGEFDVSEDLGDLWVAPSEWVAEEDKWSAWFSCGLRGDSDAYAIADLFGVGETDHGFRFMIDHAGFGGRSKWNAYAKTISEPIQKLTKLGWIHEGKGVFFRPITLSFDTLVSAWENEDWSEALSPLGQALDALVAARSDFDTIIANGRMKPE